MWNSGSENIQMDTENMEEEETKEVPKTVFNYDLIFEKY